MGGAIRLGTASKRGAAFPIGQPRDEFSGEPGNERGTRTIRIDYDPASSAWTAHLPAIETAHPAAAWLGFRRYSVRQVSGTLADLVLEYEALPGESSFGAEDVPDDEVSEDASTEKIDITRHPEFMTAQAGWSSLAMADFYDWGAQRIYHEASLPATWVDASGETVPCPNAGATVPAEIRGMDSYLVGTGTVSVLEWSRNQPAEVIADAGKRGVPTGYAGTAANWLILSGTRRQAGGMWQRLMVYQYSAKEISGVVYEDAS